MEKFALLVRSDFKDFDVVLGASFQNVVLVMVLTLNSQRYIHIRLPVGVDPTCHCGALTLVKVLCHSNLRDTGTRKD